MFARQRGRKDSVEEALHDTQPRRARMISRSKTSTWPPAYLLPATAEVVGAGADNTGGKEQRCTYMMV